MSDDFEQRLRSGAAQTYVPSQFWVPSSGATGCPAKSGTSWLRDAPTQPYSSGHAPVTRAKTGGLHRLQFGCDHAIHEPPSCHFQQRDWYLPESKILIVDEYSTPGLAQILAAATWAG